MWQTAQGDKRLFTNLISFLVEYIRFIGQVRRSFQLPGNALASDHRSRNRSRLPVKLLLQLQLSRQTSAGFLEISIANVIVSNDRVNNVSVREIVWNN